MSSRTQSIDTLIVGQGLAGSLLAWQLMRRGQKVMVVCDEAAPSASRVAAGIFNPVTGQRLVLQDQADSMIASARQCYQQLEVQFGRTFFHALPMLRVFKHTKERQHFVQRQQDTAYTPYLGPYIDSVEGIHAPDGLCQQDQTGYLDFNALLDCLRDYFTEQECYILQHFAYADLELTESGILWRDVNARCIVFCQGFLDHQNPWFKHLPFQASKGEILTLATDAALPDQIINGNKWLLPLQNGCYKTGATYEHDLSDSEPSKQAKSELLSGLQKLLSKPLEIEVVDQQAGIRPNTLDKHPFLGFQVAQSQIGIFNGFGSKGALLIPHYAQAFADHISTGASLPSEANIDRISTAKKKVPRLALTERVQQSLLAHIKPDHIAIDATAGNGHDTLFLAQHINGSGHVFAFDIQQRAIDITHKQLSKAGVVDRVTLYCSGHESMLEQMPSQFFAKVNLIMFNLGYLPRTDKSIITQTDTTLTALNAALQLIAADGRISILAYPGHPGGSEETSAVKAWAASLSRKIYSVIVHNVLYPNSTSPVWIEVIA